MAEKSGVDITSQGLAAVVRFTTSCVSDAEGIAESSRRIKQYLDQNHPGRVVFDFENVKFFSSQVLGLLLETRARLQPINGKVVLCAVCPQLHRVFKITNLDRIFEFFPDHRAAAAIAIP